jgi:hypothetical protein
MRLNTVEAAITQAWPILSDFAKIDPEGRSLETVAVEIRRFRNQRQTPISAESVAKLCGITRREAESLRLTVLRRSVQLKRSGPEADERRRAQRLASGRIPRIVDIGIARPWIEDRLSRSHWHALNKGSGDLQLLALYAHIKRKEGEPIAKIRDKLQTVKRIRDTYCPPHHLPVDDLIDKLDGALRTSDK